MTDRQMIEGRTIGCSMAPGTEVRWPHWMTSDTERIDDADPTVSAGTTHDAQFAIPSDQQVHGHAGAEGDDHVATSGTGCASNEGVVELVPMSSTGRLSEPVRRVTHDGFSVRSGLGTIVLGGVVALVGFSLATGAVISVLGGMALMFAGLALLLIPMVVGSTDDKARERRQARDRSQGNLDSAAFVALDECKAPGSLCDCPRFHKRW